MAKMTIGEQIVKRLGGATKREVDAQQHATDRRAAEAYEAGFSDGGEDEPASGTTKRFGYKPLGGGGRDFAIDRQTALDVAWSLYQSNPLASRALEIKRDYILGRGVTFEAAEGLQEILDAFWKDNALRHRLKQFALQLFLFGVQCFPVFVRESDGRVRLGYFDPSEIEDVITHPENVLEPWAVVISESRSAEAQKWLKKYNKRVYRILRRADSGEREGRYEAIDQVALEDWEPVMLEAHGLKEYTGSCIYERVNCVSNQPFGYSDLLQVSDWADQHDETLFALGEREQMAGYFAWDVTLEGATPEEVSTKSKKIRANPPKKGSANIHNEKEVWDLKYPDLKQVQSIETTNALLTFILGGLGIPRHWYGHGDETNRATAQAQGDPTWRSMEHDQDIIKDMITLFLEFARDQAIIAKKWTPVENEEITVTMPEMTSKDLTAVTGAAAALASALMVAQDSGWVSQETAAEAWGKVMTELGVESNPTEEIEQAEEEQDGRDEAGAATANDWLAKHGVMVDELPQGSAKIVGQYEGD